MHSFGHVQFDYLLGGILVPLQNSILEDVEGLGLYDLGRLARYDLAFCLLAVRRY